jgi:YYY domain-containing protein
MFGPFLVAITGFLLVLARRLLEKGLTLGRLSIRWVAWTASFSLLPLGLMVLMAFFMMLIPSGVEFLESIRRNPFVYELVGDAPWLSVLGQLLLVKLRTWVMPLVVAGMAAMGIVLLRSSLPAPKRESGKKRASLHPSLQFVLVCIIVGLLLTLSVEFVYLVDVFRMRANTIFKFYFQAWVLMAIGSAFAVYWLGRKKDWLRMTTRVGFWILVAMGMVYPILGNYSRAGEFRHPPNLDGTAYLETSQPDDYAAIAWLNEQVQGTPTILEAPGSGGSSYVYEGRISALTGLPTLLGWAGHEGQWRGSYTIQDARDPDIKLIYNTLDPQVALTLIERHGITYVYVGPLERSTFDPRGLAKFDHLLDVVYQQGAVTIYKSK